MGLIVPGSMRPSVVLWQRLYLRPLPHQQASLAAGRTAGGRAAAGLFTLPRLRAISGKQSDQITLMSFDPFSIQFEMWIVFPQ